MDTGLIKVLVLLGIAVLLFMRGAPRSDAVALMMLVALHFTGVIMVGEAIAGFSNANIVLDCHDGHPDPDAVAVSALLTA